MAIAFFCAVIKYFVMTIIIYLAGYGDGNPSPYPAFIGGDTEVSS